MKKMTRASVTVAWASGGLLPRFSGDVRVAGARLGIRYDYGMFKQNIVNGSQKDRLTTGWNTVTRGNSNATTRV